MKEFPIRKFESKFGLEELVGFDDDREDGDRAYGHVRNIEFYKTDSVNYSCVYTIELVNSKEIKRSVHESKIQRAFS